MAHGISSAALSVAIAEIGSFFFPAYYVNLIAVILLVTVAIYIVFSATVHARAGTKAESVSMLVSIIPDPALVPFILIAQGFGVFYTIALMSAFVVAAFASVTIVVFFAMTGLSTALTKIKAQYVDYLVALALALVAAFVYLYS